eukprot:80627-Alexandrium_andersonii.AAC.1
MRWPTGQHARRSTCRRNAWRMCVNANAQRACDQSLTAPRHPLPHPPSTVAPAAATITTTVPPPPCHAIATCNL